MAKNFKKRILKKSAKTHIPAESMEAKSGQNIQTKEKIMEAETSQDTSRKQPKTDNTNKDDNVAVRETPSCWSSPTKCSINITEFLEKAKRYANLVTKDGLLTNLEELQKVEKRIAGLCGGQAFAQNLLLH